MKSVLKYIIILAVTLALTLLYGFVIGGDPELWFSIGIFIVTMVIMVLFEKKTNKKLGVRVINVVVTTVIMLSFSVILYDTINESSKNHIARYEAEVIGVEYYEYTTRLFSSNDVDLWFVTPNGEEHSVRMRRYDLPSQGDMIIIDEYKGVFGVRIYGYCGIAEKETILNTNLIKASMHCAYSLLSVCHLL